MTDASRAGPDGNCGNMAGPSRFSWRDGVLCVPDDLSASIDADVEVLAGVDIASIAATAASVDAFGDRFVGRLYTPHEAAWCRSSPSEMAARLGTRFAAKEAAIKALDLAEVGVDWRDLEVWREEGMAPRLRLHGRARAVAEARGVTHIAVSLTHDADQAGAVVVALARRPSRPASTPNARSPERGGAFVTDASDRIRAILRQHGKLACDVATLAPEADLYEAGFTSHASVNVMLALEGEFDATFPDHLLTRSVFSSVAAIEAAMSELLA